MGESLNDWVENYGKLIDPGMNQADWESVFQALSWDNQYLDNVTISDFIFTGSIDHINGSGQSGVSVLINRPGNITIDNCTWTNKCPLWYLVAQHFSQFGLGSWATPNTRAQHNSSDNTK